jgi:hypothetical protein
MLVGLMLAGCGDYGKVEQGRVVAFDKEKSTVTFSADSNIAHKKQPAYNVLPPRVYTLPTDPVERGADPTPGMRLNLDVDKKIIAMFNPQTKLIENLPFEVVADTKDVDVRRQHPLVWDAATKKAKKFPVIDAANKTVEIYSGRQKRLTTLKLSEADFSKYKEGDWGSGDDVRIYYKEPGKALRFMNITKTNLGGR